MGRPNGDFGRVRPSLTADDIHDWVGRDAARDAGAPISLYPLTDDERLLRDLAYPLIEPAYDRQRWYSVLNEWGVTRVFQPDWWRCDPTAYAARLMTMWVRSETTRYARLIEDARNDVARIEQFVPVARRVLGIDVKRERSLSVIPVLSGAEVANAHAGRARLATNPCVMGSCMAATTMGMRASLAGPRGPPAARRSRRISNREPNQFGGQRGQAGRSALLPTDTQWRWSRPST